MKLYSFSYHDKKIVREINEEIGESYSFIERLKLRGIGSKRHQVKVASSHFSDCLNAEHYQTLVSIELRPGGIMIYFRRRLDNFVAIFSYENLKIKTDKEDIILSCEDAFLVLGNAISIDKKFFDRVEKKIG